MKIEYWNNKKKDTFLNTLIIMCGAKLKNNKVYFKKGVLTPEDIEGYRQYLEKTQPLKQRIIL